MVSEDSPALDEVTAEAIMQEIYRALCAHSYADLTMVAITEESEKSQTVLDYHNGTKQFLLVAFLDYFLSCFQIEIQIDTDGTNTAPRDQIESFIEVLLFGSEYRRVDEELDSELIPIGIKQDEFRSVNQNAVTVFILSAINGERVSQMTKDGDDIAATVYARLHDCIAEVRVRPGAK